MGRGVGGGGGGTGLSCLKLSLNGVIDVQGSNIILSSYELSYRLRG